MPQLDLVIIMNSAFKYFTTLIDEINLCSSISGVKKLKIREHFVKVTSQVLNLQAVAMEDVSVKNFLTRSLLQIKVTISEEAIRGNHILVVEDLFDSGSTILKTKRVLEGM